MIQNYMEELYLDTLLFFYYSMYIFNFLYIRRLS